MGGGRVGRVVVSVVEVGALVVWLVVVSMVEVGSLVVVVGVVVSVVEVLAVSVESCF